jgi:hypothetical protein
LGARKTEHLEARRVSKVRGAKTSGTEMGLFWDLIQQNQISEQAERASSLDARVARLERRLGETRKLLQLLLERLEENLGEDIDKDGKVG